MTVGYHTKIGKISPQGLHQSAQNVFSGSGKNTTWPFGHLYPARISAILETTNINRCLGGDWREKFPNFCIGVLQAQNAIFGTKFGGAIARSLHLKRHNSGRLESFQGLANGQLRRIFKSHRASRGPSTTAEHFI